MSEVIVNDGNFEDEVLKAEGLVMVDFYADWCGPCKMMAPVIEKLASELSDKVKVCKLNVDDNPDTSMKFQIRGIPTTIFFKDGQPVEQLVGYQSEEVFRGKIDSLG